MEYEALRAVILQPIHWDHLSTRLFPADQVVTRELRGLEPRGLRSRAASAVQSAAVSHYRISADELAARHRSLGLPTLHAQTLAAMDAAIAAGVEDRVTDGSDN